TGRADRRPLRAAAISPLWWNRSGTKLRALCCLVDSSFVFPSTLGNQASKPIEFVGRNLPAFAPKQRSYCLLRGPFKKRFYKMPERGPPRDFAGNARNVYIPQPLLFMTDVPFLFQHAKLGSDGGIIGFIWQLSQHFAYGGPFELVKNIHDLPLAP